MQIRAKARRARAAFDSPYQVDPVGDWRACTPTLPRDCAVLGTVTAHGDTGALARLAQSGNYVKVRDGKISALNQRKVDLALQRAAKTAEHLPEMVSLDEWERGRP
jgi:hypothetical protein